MSHALRITRAFALAVGLVAAAGTALAQSGSTEAEVRRIDRDGNRLTLRHGEIKALDMPPMTMVFRVKDPALLDKVKVGEKIRAQIEKSGNQYYLIGVEPAP